MMGYEVHVLHAGYSGITEQGMVANCSCTLVRGRYNIIVDTMTPWDKDRVVSGLARYKLTPDDINFVVCTHGHSDHVGNNNLFLSAKHIVGYSVSFRDVYSLHPFEEGEPFVIDDDVKVIPTPGHTNADVSVIVRTRDMGTVAIVGDLFEKEEDLQDASLWRVTGGSENPRSQERYRNAVLQMADHIVPGHGPMFAVTSSAREEANKKTELSTGQVNYLPPSFVNSGFGPSKSLFGSSHPSYRDSTFDDFKRAGKSGGKFIDSSYSFKDWGDVYSSASDLKSNSRSKSEWSSKTDSGCGGVREWDTRPIYESGSRSLDKRIGREGSSPNSRSWERPSRTTDEFYSHDTKKKSEFDKSSDERFLSRSYDDRSFSYTAKLTEQRTPGTSQVLFDKSDKLDRLTSSDRYRADDNRVVGLCRDESKVDLKRSSEVSVFDKEPKYSGSGKVGWEGSYAKCEQFNKRDEIRLDVKLGHETGSDRRGREIRVGQDDKSGLFKSNRNDGDFKSDRFGEILKDEKSRWGSGAVGQEKGYENWGSVERNRSPFSARHETLTKLDEKSPEPRSKIFDDAASKITSQEKFHHSDDLFKTKYCGRSVDDPVDWKMREPRLDISPLGKRVT